MNTQYDKEWFDEPGYCNCLLVTMSRARIPSLEIRAGDVVPNLEVLAASRPDTAAWIRAQEFQYSRLSSTEVISMLSQSANISRLPWRKKEGVMQLIDVDGDIGAKVQGIRIRQRRERGAQVLRIELEDTAEPAR